jgi:hypothetical protein
MEVVYYLNPYHPYGGCCSCWKIPGGERNEGATTCVECSECYWLVPGTWEE